MATFNNNNIYFNETTVNFKELGKIYPIGYGNIPFYRFKYKGKLLKRTDFKFLTDHLKINWNQITRIEDEETNKEHHDSIECQEKYND